MRCVLLVLLAFIATPILAQCPVTGEDTCHCNDAVAVGAAPEVSSEVVPESNPELEILFPWEDGPFLGAFVVQTKNIEYIPELATNAGTAFAVGVDALGDPLRLNEGHLHGWIFALDEDGKLIRGDNPPSPVSYVRFYGAGGAEFTGNKTLGFYIKPDDLGDLPKGRYRVFFQAQFHDHTAMRQLNAPAFPAVASRDFFIWGNQKNKGKGKGNAGDKD